MKCNKSVLLFIIAPLMLIFPTAAEATDGYWALGFGTRSKGMAGAGVALAQDGMDAASNPATMVDLGDRMDLGLAAFVPDRHYTAHEDGTVLKTGTHQSEDQFFLIPHFAVNRMLDRWSSIALTIGCNGGMETEYDHAVFSSFGEASSPTGIDLKQCFLGVTYARKIFDRHSFGITPIFAVQAINIRGLEPFRAFSDDPEHVTNKGNDWSYGAGARVGWLSRLTDRFAVGISYQTQVEMSRFDDYRGLFAEHGSFDIPPNLTFGIAFSATPTLTFAIDAQRIWFGDIKSIANRGDRQLVPGAIVLGTDDGPGFGWDDIWVGKFGAQWVVSPDLTLRAGYSVNDRPYSGDQYLFNILTPAVITEHYTLGLTTRLGDRDELSFALMYAPEKSLDGDNPNIAPQTGSLDMQQFELEVSWGRRF